MKRRSLALPGALLLCLILSPACEGPQGMYHWGGYEASLHALAKDPSSLQKYALTLEDQIRKGEPENRVPPGIYAEYGYVLLVSKRNPEAIVCFQKEKARWPESTQLMDRMIKLATDPAAAPEKKG